MKRSSMLSKMCVLIGGVTLTIVGFMIIPKLIDKYGNKLYKQSLKKEKIDFADMGPDIVTEEES